MSSVSTIGGENVRRSITTNTPAEDHGVDADDAFEELRRHRAAQQVGRGQHAESGRRT
jgi:hypothetical protein